MEFNSPLEDIYQAEVELDEDLFLGLKSQVMQLTAEKMNLEKVVDTQKVTIEALQASLMTQEEATVAPKKRRRVKVEEDAIESLKTDYYRKHKNDKELLNRLRDQLNTAFEKQGLAFRVKRVPWQIVRQATDREFAQQTPLGEALE